MLDPITLVALSLVVIPVEVDVLEIVKDPTPRYYGEFVGPRTDEGFWDPGNYVAETLEEIEFLVVHATEGFEAGDRQVLSGKSKTSRVSAHYYIPREGPVTEYVPTTIKAWHAGKSRYALDGKDWVGFKHFSIGVELECRYIEDPKYGCSDFTASQMENLVALHRSLQEKYPKLQNPNRTVGHEDISGYRGKTDPGPAFDWHLFRAGAFEGEDVPPPPFSVMVDGELIKQRILLVDGRAYLPLRVMATICGLDVKWFSQEKRVELVSQNQGEKKESTD